MTRLKQHVASMYLKHFSHWLQALSNLLQWRLAWWDTKGLFMSMLSLDLLQTSSHWFLMIVNQWSFHLSNSLINPYCPSLRSNLNEVRALKDHDVYLTLMNVFSMVCYHSAMFEKRSRGLWTYSSSRCLCDSTMVAAGTGRGWGSGVECAATAVSLAGDQR